MARVIKFRAWNKKMKIMKEVFAINMTVPCYSVGVHLENPTWFEDEIELMQFTGLLDRNGKKIYEGDVCRDILSEEKFAVVFRGGQFMAHNLRNEREGSLFGCIPNFEIIDNIYESPDLLTEEKEK